MAEVPRTNDHVTPVAAVDDPGEGARSEGYSATRPPGAGAENAAATAAVPEVAITNGPPETPRGTWNAPRHFDDPAEMERFFQRLAGDTSRGGPYVFVKPDAQPGQRGYAEYEGRVVTQADIDAGLRVVSSENPEGQRPRVGDLVMWKLDANGQRQGQPWTPGADMVNMSGEDKDGARYKFARQDGDRMIFSPRAVPTEMVPLNERVSLRLSWGTASGGPGAMLVRYGANDINVITNYDFVRMYERGTDPASQEVYDKVKRTVDGAFESMRTAGGEEVRDANGRQVWNFGNNRNVEDVSRTAAAAAAQLGIDVKVGINGVFATMKPGMTPAEFQAEYAKAKAAVDAFRAGTQVSNENGREVRKFGPEVPLDRASALAVQAAEAMHQDVRVQVGNTEVTARPGMTQNEFKAVHQTVEAATRAANEYFPASEVKDAAVRERLQSLYLRSNIETIAKQFDVSQQRLIALMDPAQQNLMRSSQPDVADKATPLNPEERSLLDRALLDRFYENAERHRAAQGQPPEFRPAGGGAPGSPEAPADLGREIAAARARAGTPEERAAIEAIEREQAKWTAEERAKAARYLKMGAGMAISVAIVAGGVLAMVSAFRARGQGTAPPPVVFG